MAGIFGAITEEMPKYEVLETTDGFEIRQYGPTIVIETTFQGEKGQGKANSDAAFTLAGYIGFLAAPKNKSKASGKAEAIAMTAPVIMQEDMGEKVAMTAPVVMEEKKKGAEGSLPTQKMQFVLPSKYTMETVPTSLDPRVTVKQVPGKRVGVVRFSGTWNVKQVEQKAVALKEMLEAAGHKPVGVYMTAFYNSPVTIPYFRRNEVWYKLQV